MSTYSQNQETAPQYRERATHGLRHSVTTAIGMVLGAVLVGAVVGLLLAALIEGPPAVQVHHAGAHGKVGILQDMQRVAAGTATEAQGASEGSASARTVIERSPARGGFAVGRTFDVGGAAANTQGPATAGEPQP